MGSDSEIVSFDANGYKDDIQAFKTREDLTSQSDACRELVRIGLRETRSPIVYRLKEEVINWVGWLALAAIVVIITGITTTALTPPHAFVIAIVMLSVAAGLLAMVELVRVLRGQSELGEHIHGVID